MFRLCSPQGIGALVKLASRETQLILLACGGMTDKEIAKALSISIGTVITLWSTIRGKLGISSRAAAVAGIAWAVAKLEARNVPELDEVDDLADNGELRPAILILGKQHVVLMCNALAGNMFETVPGMTFDKSPRLARTLTSHRVAETGAQSDFPWNRLGEPKSKVEDILQIAYPGGSTQQVLVKCTFADDPVFGRVAVLRVFPSNDYSNSDRQTSENFPEGKESGRSNAALKSEPPTPRPTEPELAETPVALGAVEDVETFAAMVVHDLEGPVRAIFRNSLALSETIRDKEILAEIRSDAERLTVLLEGLSRYALVDASMRKLAPVALQDFIVSIVDKAGGVEVDVDNLTFEADVDALDACVRGLLENALKSTSESKSPKIRITGRSVGGRCQIAVRDNGMGFDIGDRGADIGLTLVAIAAARLGGVVVPQSSAGKGATFTLDFPL